MLLWGMTLDLALDLALGAYEDTKGKVYFCILPHSPQKDGEDHG